MIKQKNDNRYFLQSTLGEARAWFDQGCPGAPGAKRTGALDAKYDSWRGGSVASMNKAIDGGLNMKPYRAALEKLAPIFRQFTASHASSVPKRRRTLSEFDGEWQYERRAEDKPFFHVQRQAVPQRVIRVEVNSAVSGGMGQDDFDAYGAIVWASVQLLERAGKRCEVFWINEVTSDPVYTVRIPLKKASEYVAPSVFAATLTANFYRRIGFALQCYSTEAHGTPSCPGLGSPVRKEPVAYKEGVLTFCATYSHYWGGETFQKELEKALTNAA